MSWRVLLDRFSCAAAAGRVVVLDADAAAAGVARRQAGPLLAGRHQSDQSQSEAVACSPIYIASVLRQ